MTGQGVHRKTGACPFDGRHGFPRAGAFFQRGHNTVSHFLINIANRFIRCRTAFRSDFFIGIPSIKGVSVPMVIHHQVKKIWLILTGVSVETVVKMCSVLPGKHLPAYHQATKTVTLRQSQTSPLSLTASV